MNRLFRFLHQHADDDNRRHVATHPDDSRRHIDSNDTYSHVSIRPAPYRVDSTCSTDTYPHVSIRTAPYRLDRLDSTGSSHIHAPPNPWGPPPYNNAHAPNPWPKPNPHPLRAPTLQSLNTNMPPVARQQPPQQQPPAIPGMRSPGSQHLPQHHNQMPFNKAPPQSYISAQANHLRGINTAATVSQTWQI